VTSRGVFKRLRDFFDPPKPALTERGYAIPFELTPPEWEALKGLMERPEWAVYLRALDFCANLSAETILSATTDESLHFHRGIVVGIRKAAFLPVEARNNETSWVNEQLAAERRRRPERERSVALFGSPAWSKRSEPGAPGR
jgi:hypothetical protein